MKMEYIKKYCLCLRFDMCMSVCADGGYATGGYIKSVQARAHEKTANTRIHPTHTHTFMVADPMVMCCLDIYIYI